MGWSRWFGVHELPENINSNDRRPINKFVAIDSVLELLGV
jgi:hypothetical protein